MVRIQGQSKHYKVVEKVNYQQDLQKTDNQEGLLTFMSLISRYSSMMALAFFFITSGVSSGAGETEAEVGSGVEGASGVSLGDSLPPSRSWVLR